MTSALRLSDRLREIVDALPLRPGMRVLEVGGAPGTAARAVARRMGNGHILVIDRSAKGVASTEKVAAAEIAAGLLLTPTGQLFTDGGDPLLVVDLHDARGTGRTLADARPEPGRTARRPTPGPTGRSTWHRARGAAPWAWPR